MKWKTISLTNKEGLELFCGPFNELPIQEDFILKKAWNCFTNQNHALFTAPRSPANFIWNY